MQSRTAFGPEQVQSLAVRPFRNRQDIADLLMKHLSHTLYESTLTHQCTALLHNVGYSNTSEVCFGPNQLVTAKQSCDVVKDLSILQAQPKPEKGSSAYSSSEAMQALLQWR